MQGGLGNWRPRFRSLGACWRLLFAMGYFLPASKRAGQPGVLLPPPLRWGDLWGFGGGEFSHHLLENAVLTPGSSPSYMRRSAWSMASSREVRSSVEGPLHPGTTLMGHPSPLASSRTPVRSFLNPSNAPSSLVSGRRTQKLVPLRGEPPSPCFGHSPASPGATSRRTRSPSAWPPGVRSRP